jgi:hypothetical protein
MTEERTQLRLAAVPAADVVGHGRLKATAAVAILDRKASKA